VKPRPGGGLWFWARPSLAQARATPLSEEEWRPGMLLWSSLGEGRHCWARGCLAQASQDSPKRACEKVPTQVAISPKWESIAREYPSHLSEGSWLERDALRVGGTLLNCKLYCWFMMCLCDVWNLWNERHGMFCIINWIHVIEESWHVKSMNGLELKGAWYCY